MKKETFCGYKRKLWTVSKNLFTKSHSPSLDAGLSDIAGWLEIY